MTAARTFSLCRLARTKESLSSTFGDPACNVCLEEPAPGCTMRHRGLYPFLKPPDGGRRPAPSAVDDEQDRDAEERRGRRDRAQDDHELTRPDGPARTDRGQRRRRSATEPRKPRDAGPRDRAAERTSRVLPRKAPKGLEPLVRNRAGSGTQSDDQARNPEETRE